MVRSKLVMSLAIVLYGTKKQNVVQTRKLNIHFVSAVYYSVANHPVNQVNPFAESTELLTARVGDMNWGKTSEVRQRTMLRFCYTFQQVMRCFDVKIALEDLWTSIQEQDKKNATLIREWIELSHSIKTKKN